MQSQYDIGKISEDNFNFFISKVIEIMKKQDADIKTIGFKFEQEKRKILELASKKPFIKSDSIDKNLERRNNSSTSKINTPYLDSFSERAEESVKPSYSTSFKL
jgi:pimeloyl-CoA synthetase